MKHSEVVHHPIACKKVTPWSTKLPPSCPNSFRGFSDGPGTPVEITSAGNADSPRGDTGPKIHRQREALQRSDPFCSRRSLAPRSGQKSLPATRQQPRPMALCKGPAQARREIVIHSSSPPCEQLCAKSQSLPSISVEPGLTVVQNRSKPRNELAWRNLYAHQVQPGHPMGTVSMHSKTCRNPVAVSELMKAAMR